MEELKRAMQHNEKTYYLYSIFAELLILGPIMVLFLVAKGLSFTEIMLLQSISAISIVIFEVPTGAAADRLGRKYSVLVGALLWGVSLIIYMLGHSFLFFSLAEITFSLGSAFKSGADSALIYDSLKTINKEKEYQKIEGKARSLSLYAQAAGSIIAGYVYEINIFLPMIISVLFMVFTAVIAFKFVEPPVEDECNSHKSSAYFNQIWESGSFILKNSKLKAIVLFTMIFFVFYRTGFWYFQPYMEAVNIPVHYFGILFFVFNITAAFASKRSHLFMQKTKPKTLTVLSLLLIISFAFMGIVYAWVGVIAILLQQFARGFYRPVTTKYMNKHIPSDKRATILSFQSLCANLTVAAAFPFMGILKDSTDIFKTHLVLAASMSFLILLWIIYMHKNEIKNSTSFS